MTEIRSDTGPDTGADLGARKASRRVEIALTLLVLATILIFLGATFGQTSAFAQASSGRGPFFFPRIVLALLLLMVPLLFAEARQGSYVLPPVRPLARMGLLMLLTGLYCGLIGVLGFLIASVLFAFAVPVLLGRRDMAVLGVIAVAYAAALWLLFEKVFLIILPASPWPLGF